MMTFKGSFIVCMMIGWRCWTTRRKNLKSLVFPAEGWDIGELYRECFVFDYCRPRGASQLFLGVHTLNHSAKYIADRKVMKDLHMRRPQEGQRLEKGARAHRANMRRDPEKQRIDRRTMRYFLNKYGSECRNTKWRVWVLRKRGWQKRGDDISPIWCTCWTFLGKKKIGIWDLEREEL